jgi:hypothetical protein
MARGGAFSISPMRRSTGVILLIVFAVAVALTALGLGIGALVTNNSKSGVSTASIVSASSSSSSYSKVDVLSSEDDDRRLAPIVATLDPDLVDVCDRVVIRRSASRGMPVIIASNDLDAMTGVGYALADERFFQLDFYRKLGGARLSELMGSSTLGLDIQLWTIDPFPDHNQVYGLLPDAYREEIDAIAKGINVWLMGNESVLPGEYTLLGFANKSEIDPFTGVDIVNIGIALAFTTIDTSDLANTNKLGQLLASQPLSSITPGICAPTAGLPFSLAYNPDCFNLMRFLMTDLVGHGARRANFAMPTADEYLNWFNVTPGMNTWSKDHPSAKRAAQQDPQQPPVPTGTVEASLPANMDLVAPAVTASVTLATTFAQTLKERLESMAGGILLNPEHGSNAMAFNGPRVKSNIMGGTRSVLLGAPDNAPVFPSFFHHLRVIVDGENAPAECVAGGEGLRGKSADAYINFVIGIPLFVNTKNIAMSMTTRYADNVDIFVELLALSGGAPVAAISGRPSEAPRPTQLSVRQFYARVSGAVVSVLAPQVSVRIPANNYATVVSLSPIDATTLANATLASAATIQTMLSKSWRPVTLERMMRFKNVMEAENAFRESLLPASFHLIMADKSGNIAHMPVGLRVPLREDFELYKQPDIMGPQLIRDGYSMRPHRWILNASAAPNTPPFKYLPYEEFPHIVNPANHQLFQANQDPLGVAYNDPIEGTRMYRLTTGGMVYIQPVGRMSARAYQLNQELPASGSMSLDTIKSAESTRSPYYMTLVRYLIGAYDWAQAHPSSVTATSFLPGSAITPSAMSLLRRWGGKCVTAAIGDYDWNDDVSLPAPLTRSPARMNESAGCTVVAIAFDALLHQHADALCSAAGVSTVNQTARAEFCPMSETAMAWLMTYNETGGVLDSGLDLLATSVPVVATRDERRVLWLLKALDQGLASLSNATRFPVFAGSSDVSTYQWGKMHRFYAPHTVSSTFGVPTAFDVKLPRQPAADGLDGYPYPSGFMAPFQTITGLESGTAFPLQSVYSDDKLAKRHTTPHMRLVSALGGGSSSRWLFESVLQLGTSGLVKFVGLPGSLIVPATNNSDDQFYSWIANKYFDKDDDLYRPRP